MMQRNRLVVAVVIGVVFVLWFWKRGAGFRVPTADESPIVGTLVRYDPEFLFVDTDSGRVRMPFAPNVKINVHGEMKLAEAQAALLDLVGTLRKGATSTDDWHLELNMPTGRQIGTGVLTDDEVWRLDLIGSLDKTGGLTFTPISNRYFVENKADGSRRPYDGPGLDLKKLTLVEALGREYRHVVSMGFMLNFAGDGARVTAHLDAEGRATDLDVVRTESLAETIAKVQAQGAAR
jgi:hypothetical protein